MAIARITRLRILEETNETFESVHARFYKHVKANEPNLLKYSLGKSKNDPSEYVIYEEYPDEGAMVAHGRTVHFNNEWTKLGLFIEGHPETLVTEVLTD